MKTLPLVLLAAFRALARPPRRPEGFLRGRQRGPPIVVNAGVVILGEEVSVVDIVETAKRPRLRRGEAKWMVFPGEQFSQSTMCDGRPPHPGVIQGGRTRSRAFTLISF